MKQLRVATDPEIYDGLLGFLHYRDALIPLFIKDERDRCSFCGI